VYCFHHSSDWENDEGVIRQADAQGMGIVLMRPLTSGVFQRLMQLTFPEIDSERVGRLLLNYVPSDPYVDVALIGMRDLHLVEVKNGVSDDVASRIDLAALHDRYVRSALSRSPLLPCGTRSSSEANAARRWKVP
jgi:predicted aldo/keto reductase-like oxidoreductase